MARRWSSIDAHEDAAEFDQVHFCSCLVDRVVGPSAGLDVTLDVPIGVPSRVAMRSASTSNMSLISSTWVQHLVFAAFVLSLLV